MEIILIIYLICIAMQKAPTYIGTFAVDHKQADHSLKNYAKECVE